MSLPWCQKCKRNCKQEDHINSSCLACKWQYVGQEAFDRKQDLFEYDPEIKECKTPYDYFGVSIESAGVEII